MLQLVAFIFFSVGENTFHYSCTSIFPEHCPSKRKLCFCRDAENSAPSGFILTTSVPSLSTCIMTVGSRWECLCGGVFSSFAAQNGTSNCGMKLTSAAKPFSFDICLLHSHLQHQCEIKMIILLQKQKSYIMSAVSQWFSTGQSQNNCLGANRQQH